MSHEIKIESVGKSEKVHNTTPLLSSKDSRLGDNTLWWISQDCKDDMKTIKDGNRPVLYSPPPNLRGL